MANIKKLHQQILVDLNKLPGKSDRNESQWLQHYLGTLRPVHGVKTADLRTCLRQFSKSNPLTVDELVDLLDLLYSKAKTVEEIMFAAGLIGLYPKLIPQIPLKKFEYWLTFCHGWVEVDTLCSSPVTAEIMLANFTGWSKLLQKLSVSKNINQRRASLVFLCLPLRQSADPRLSRLSLELVEKLKWEKDILITKAVSWVLRSMVKNYSSLVGDYLDHQGQTLPKIALRETRRKLETGRKN